LAISKAPSSSYWALVWRSRFFWRFYQAASAAAGSRLAHRAVSITSRSGARHR
jgi:hypothetical protein